MKLKQFLSSPFLFKGIFAASLIILISVITIEFQHRNSLRLISNDIIHDYQLNNELDQLISFIKDAETGLRGYIITNDRIFLQPYHHSNTQVIRSLSIIKHLTKDNAIQQNNLIKVQQLVNRQHADFLEIISFAGNNTPNKGGEYFSMLKGKMLMDSIRLQINKMTVLEIEGLKTLSIQYEEEIAFSPPLMILLALCLLVFILSYLKINRDYSSLKQANKKLTVIIESFKHAEVLGSFCYSEWDLQTNQLFYSENLYAMLGCQVNEFEPMVDNYVKFVHPDDRHIVLSGAENIIHDKAIYELEYRIICKDGGLRYFKSLGKIVTHPDGDRVHIGIMKDITQYQLVMLALEQQNKALEESNNELASFNYIASHDLQEPLRKIQLFISRFNEKEIQSLSENSKIYFAKINVAANRMRLLIEDLLIYSKTTTTDEIFKPTDLNELVTFAKDELIVELEKKEGIITVVSLPVLSVIPFQIQQLFINLISNAIKYSRPQVAPVIYIDCKKVFANDWPVLKTVNKNFYKVSVADNGTGFHEQFADQVFMPFKRLQNVAGNPGTGVGLAICKKIVEGHGGIIYAESTPGNGATFTFFLPA